MIYNLQVKAFVQEFSIEIDDKVNLHKKIRINN